MAPVTAGIEYTTPVFLQRPVVGPLIEPLVHTITEAYTFSVFDVQLPIQFTAFTVMLPDLKEEVALTTIEVVPCPDMIVAPVPVTVHR